MELDRYRWLIPATKLEFGVDTLKRPSFCRHVSGSKKSKRRALYIAFSPRSSVRGYMIIVLRITKALIPHFHAFRNASADFHGKRYTKRSLLHVNSSCTTRQKISAISGYLSKRRHECIQTSSDRNTLRRQVSHLVFLIQISSTRVRHTGYFSLRESSP